jgi:hypothetical protein
MATRTILVNGRPVEIPDSATGEQLRTLARLDPNRRLLRRADNQYQPVQMDQAVQPVDGDEFIDAPVRTKGVLFSFAAPIAHDQERANRVASEAVLLATQFHEGVDYDEQHHDWVRIRTFSLPPGWEHGASQLLIIPPAGYPIVPPTGFYLSAKSTRWHKEDPHFLGFPAYGAADLRCLHWYWYCVTVNKGRGGWRPQSDYRQPDNLVSFCAMAYDALSRED